MATEISQTGLLAAVTLDAANISVSASQAVVLSVASLKPLPLPVPIVPDVPVRETWTYNTVLNITESGSEQRSALWASPKLGMKFNAILLGEQDRRSAYDFLARSIGELFTYPLFMHSTKLGLAATAGDTKLYFDPAATDLRNGEIVALFDPRLEQTRLLLLSTVDADGGTLAAGLPYDIPAHWLICAAPVYRLASNAGFSMNHIDGEIDVALIGSSVRQVLRPNQSAGLLTTYDGMAVLDKRPLADNEVASEFDRNVTWLDTGAVAPIAFKPWRAAYVGGNRVYRADRPAGLDYWRAFADHARGRQNPFLVPTFRNDLPLTSEPALSASSLVTSNHGFAAYSGSWAYRYVRIQSDAGVIYRRVDDVRLSYDEVSGEPVSATVFLDADIGAGVGSNTNMVVSFAHTCRLDSDTITLEHEAVDTFIAITIRAIEE